MIKTQSKNRNNWVEQVSDLIRNTRWFNRPRLNLSVLLLTLLVILSALFSFANLTTQPLAIWDEYTNFNVVYDTIDSDSGLVLQYNGEPFFEKPPLWYWLTMEATNLWGINNFSVRVVSATAGFLSILLVCYLGWKMFSPKAGIVAGFVMLATPQLFLRNTHIFATHTFRSADLDALQILFMLLTTLSLYCITLNRNRYIWAIFSGIFTGLAFLTKGPFAFIPPLLFFMFSLLNFTREKPLIVRGLQPAASCLLFAVSCLLIIIPWHLAMVHHYGSEFITNYLSYHMLSRTTQALEGHHESLLFYLKLLFRKDFFFSGEVLFIAMISLALKYKRKLLQSFGLFYSYGTVLSLLIIITLIQTKLAWYLLPLYPFTALLIGKFWECISERKELRFKTLSVLITIVLLVQIVFVGWKILAI